MTATPLPANPGPKPSPAATAPRVRARVVSASLGALFSLASMPSPGTAQPFTDDFNDGNDNGWTRYDPLASAVPPGPFAHFSFPNGAYRIQADASPAPAQLGPARAAGLRIDATYSDFYVAVDLVAWNTNLDQAMGILARIGTPGLGTTVGYAFTYQEQDHDFSIAKIVGEAGNDIPGTSMPITLDPTNRYRLVFLGRGAFLEGRIYQLPDNRHPIATTSATDPDYPSGINGLLAYDNSSAASATADATFDNYFALDVEPPVLEIEAQDFGDMQVSWSANITGFTLQASPVLPGTNWVSIPADQIQTDPFTQRRFHVTSGLFGNQFFRMVRP